MMHRKAISNLRMSIIIVLCLTATISATPVDSPVADAAQRGDIERVRSLLKQAADVNAAQADGMTAVHWAALNGNVEMTEMLLYAGASIKATTRVGAYTALLVAAKFGQASTVPVLLKAGADANAATTAGITAVMLAAMAGSAETTRLLLDHGADGNAVSQAYGQTALMLAADLDRVDVIKVLTAHGAKVSIATKVRKPKPRDRGGTNQNQQAANQANNQANNDERAPADNIALGGLTALHYAAREGHAQAVRALLDAGAKVNQVTADGTSPLLMAATNGQFDLAMLLLERGANPNLADTPGATPLYAALNIQWAFHVSYPKPSPKQQKVSHVALVKELLDHGADPNIKIKEELWWTGFGSNGGVGSGINEVGATPFWRAAQSSDVDVMRLLVARGADPIIPNAHGITPLSVAAGMGWQGNVNVNSPVGWMPAIRYLVEELGTDVNLRNKPQGKAAEPKDQTCLRDGESIPPDNYGWCNSGTTALHAAAERGDNEMILYLLSKGADVTIVSDRGQTVADMANGPKQRMQPFVKTLELLVNLGARHSNKCVSC
jgi:uncharacterized protein